jgi:uncharacterized protein YukE
MTKAVTWEPKVAAMRDLVLLALHEAGGTISSENGKASALLLEKCGVPHSRAAMGTLSTATRTMHSLGMIDRKNDPSSRRTFSFSLKQPLTEEEVGRLRRKEGVMRELCSNSSRPSSVHNDGDWLTPLYDDCVKAIGVLRTAFREAEKATPKLAVVNARGVLKAVNIKGQRADEVLYYLKQLGIAKAAQQEDRFLWWWEVSFEKELDREKLRKKATGRDAFEGEDRSAPVEVSSQATPRTLAKLGSRQPEGETPRPVNGVSFVPTVIFSAPEPAVQPKPELSEPVVVSSGEQPEEPPLKQLVALAEQLEADYAKSEEERQDLLRKLEDQAQEFDRERSELMRKHAEAMKEGQQKYEATLSQLREKIETLDRELAAAKARANEAESALDQRATTLIERLKRRLNPSQ